MPVIPSPALSQKGRWRGICLSVSFCVFALLLSLLTPSQSPSNEPPHCGGTTLSGSTIDKVLELVLPKDEGLLTPYDYRITLRFYFEWEPESQIILKCYDDDRCDVTLFSLPPEAKHITEQLHDIKRETGREDPEEMAKRIEVRVERVEVPAGVVRDLMGKYGKLRLSPRLPTDFSQSHIGMGGYNLWYETVLNDVHVKIVGPEPEYDANAHPLIRWMNDVKRAVEAARQVN